MQNFIPLSEIQKAFTFSPIKTYRLFAQLRLQGSLNKDIDWIFQDNKILLDIARFFTELENRGYKNFLREEYSDLHPKSIENSSTPDEIISEPTEIAEEEKNEETGKEVISSDTEIISDTNQMISSDIIGVKNEIIEILKEGVARAEREAETLRSANGVLLAQNQQLSNVAYRLMPPPSGQGSGKDGNLPPDKPPQEMPTHVVEIEPTPTKDFSREELPETPHS